MKNIEGAKRKALLLSLIETMSNKGSWSGETHVQKCVYFLQTMLRVPLAFDFILYKHGPFSFDLRDELTAMRADDLLRLEVQSPYGPSFRLTDTGNEMTSLFPRTIQSHHDRIGFVAGSISNRTVSDLERLGTALYVTNEPAAKGTPGSVDSRAERICSLKPHFSLERAREALQEVDRLTSESKSLRV